MPPHPFAEYVPLKLNAQNNLLVKNMNWLWQISSPICAHEYDGMVQSWPAKLHLLKRRLSFMAKAVPLTDALLAYRNSAGSPLQRAIEQRPYILGVVIWPYMCWTWPVKTKLQRVAEHYKVIGRMGSIFDFPMDKAVLLLNLEEVTPGLRVIMDQPKWLMREGLLVVNLFMADVRIYSLAFSFALEDDQVVVHIGAVQGVDTEGILEEYKTLTKALHGMRPRDFLLEVFRTLCRCAGVAKIYAVDDAKRQQRSSYFGAAKANSLFMDYNDIWVERGAIRHNDEFFILSLDTPMKNLDEVASKKRAMFRRRYELLHSIEQQISGVLNGLTARNVISVPGKLDQ